MKKKIILIIISILVITIITIISIPKNDKHYDSIHFNIEIIKSDIDYNNNGIDDYTDILNGARIDAQKKPTYKSAYYSGGYPPEDEGVCTDLVWRALKEAGYLLKDMIDEDIKNNVSLYPRVENKPNPNIDFRRVKNLKVFMDRTLTSLSLDPYDINKWMPGDIVIFGEDYTHIGIISDKRNKKGIPYLLHNAGQWNREEDALINWSKNKGITGHYRWEII